jgi:hypothetical protein
MATIENILNRIKTLNNREGIMVKFNKVNIFIFCNNNNNYVACPKTPSQEFWILPKEEQQVIIDEFDKNGILFSPATRGEYLTSAYKILEY